MQDIKNDNETLVWRWWCLSAYLLRSRKDKSDCEAYIFIEFVPIPLNSSNYLLKIFFVDKLFL